MREAKKTLIRVIGLIWILAALMMVIGTVVYFIRPFAFLPYFLGEVLGSVVSTLLMLHRYSTLDVELDLERKSAQNHLKLMATIRSVIALAALFLSFRFPGLFSPVTTFAGLFATKASALLYPLFFRERTSSSEGEPEEISSEIQDDEFPAEH